jgi:hypothetical protein
LEPCTWLTENTQSGETEFRISQQCKLNGRNNVAELCKYSCGLCPTPTPPVPTPVPPVPTPVPPVPEPTPPVSQPTPPVSQPTPPVSQPTPPVSQPTPASEPEVGGAKNPSGNSPTPPTGNSPTPPTGNSPTPPTGNSPTPPTGNPPTPPTDAQGTEGTVSDPEPTEGTVVLYYRADVYHSTTDVDSAIFQSGLNSFFAGTQHKMLNTMHNRGIPSINFQSMDFGKC